MVAVEVLVVVLAGVAVFGYIYLTPASKPPSTSTVQNQTSSVAAQTMIPAPQANVVISNAALSNNSLLLTIQNEGSQAVSLNTLLITPGTGCNFTSFATSRSSQANQTAQQNQTRIPFSPPTCIARAAPFTVQGNGTLTPLAAGRFNASRLFNSTFFNSTRSFSRSANFSRTTSGNFSRGAFGNFSLPGGFLGNLSRGLGLQLAAGQSVSLSYDGPIGSGVVAGSQYTILVIGAQAEATITVGAT